MSSADATVTPTPEDRAEAEARQMIDDMMLLMRAEPGHPIPTLPVIKKSS